MATKKVYPFIHAKMFDLEDNIDGKEADGACATVNFKSGKKMYLSLALDQEVYPGDNLITAIDMVQYSHFWHDNEDSLPDEDEE